MGVYLLKSSHKSTAALGRPLWPFPSTRPPRRS
jgi:hypothetical protein